MNQTTEQFWPYIAALIGLGLWAFWLGMPFPAKPDALFGATGTTAAVLVGFLATAKAIVLSISTTAVYRKLKENGYSELLIRYLFEAVSAGILLLVFSVIGFFFDQSKPIPGWYTIIWIFVAWTVIFSFFRFAVLLFRLLRQA